MAQTEQDIYNAIVADAATRAALAPVANASSTSRLGQMWGVIANAARNLQLLYDALTSSVNAAIARGTATTELWYQQKCLAFQYGDEVALINNVPAYAVIDITSQIVAYASVLTNKASGEIIIKVAKSVSGIITQLTSDELTAFESYMNAIQGAGDRIVINSLAADTLRIAGKIWYSGQIPLATIQANVAAAVAAYLTKIQFNGNVQIIDLEEAIAAVTGINDIGLTYYGWGSGGMPTIFVGTYPTSSGYIALDASSGNTIADLVTFIAE